MGRRFTQAQLDALSVVRNMAYDYQDQGQVIHDLPDQKDGDGGLAFQAAALDTVDELLIKAKIEAKRARTEAMRVEATRSFAAKRGWATRRQRESGNDQGNR